VTRCLGGRGRPCPDLSMCRSEDMWEHPRVTVSFLGWLPHRARNGHAAAGRPPGLVA